MKKAIAAMRVFLGVVAAALWLPVSATTTDIYYHNDLAGTPLAATEANGNLLWRQGYKPYGERLDPKAPAEQQPWFTGKAHVEAAGLSYFGARWYDPQLGRFMGVDPRGFDEANVHSFNRYAYANNNPYRFVDPDGRVAETIFDVISFGFSVEMFRREPTVGNFLGAALDGLAVAVPFVPGGVGAIRSVGKAAEAGAQISKEVTLSRRLHGEAAQHADDAIHAGKPDVLTIDRAGAAANRQDSTGAFAKVPGKHLDEYPPAMFKEGGTGASVRAINPRDNLSAGACIGNACRGLPDGSQVRIRIGE